MPVRRSGDALARPARQRPADRRVQPVPPAARRLPPERPHVRLRAGRPDRRPGPRRARDDPRRVDDRGARRASGMADAGDIRYRLVQQLLREGAKRGAARFHVACADADGNVELLMQAGLHPLRRGAGPVPAGATGRCPTPWTDKPRRRPRHPAGASGIDALALQRLYDGRDPDAGRAPGGDPPAGLGAPGHALAGAALQPRADPALRRRRGLRPGVADGGKDGTQLDGVPPGRRRQGGPAALPQGRRPARGRRDRRSSSSVWASSRRGRARAATIVTTTASSRPCEPTKHRSTGVWRRPASNRSRASRCS